MTRTNPKICFVTTGDIKKISTAKRALGMANHLNELGWEVSILMQEAEENHLRADMECNEKIAIHFFKPSSFKGEIKQKNELLAKIQPDIVYLCGFVFRNMIKTSAYKISEHCELQSSMKRLPILQRFRHSLTEYYSVIYSDALVNASDYLMKVFKQRRRFLLRKIPMLYLPYAYNKNVCQVLPKEQRTDGKKIFVFLGSLTINYGALLICQVFEKLQSTHPECLLQILGGSGKDVETIHNYVKEHKISNVEFKGYVPEKDIPTYFSNADAFLSPMNDTVQDWARCPSKLYMYLPYKKPIITCKIGEPYIVLRDKGTYYACGSMESMYDAIVGLLEKDEWTLDIDPTKHEWEARCIAFDQWIKSLGLKE